MATLVDLFIVISMTSGTGAALSLLEPLAATRTLPQYMEKFTTPRSRTTSNKLLSKTRKQIKKSRLFQIRLPYFWGHHNAYFDQII